MSFSVVTKTIWCVCVTLSFSCVAFATNGVLQEQAEYFHTETAANTGKNAASELTNKSSEEVNSRKVGHYVDTQRQLGETRVTLWNGNWGNWLGDTSGPPGYYACGAQLRSENNQGGGDDTAANGLIIKWCQYNNWNRNTWRQVNAGSWGTWKSRVSCPYNHWIVDAQVQYEDPQGGGDDTALNGLYILCASATFQQATGRTVYEGSFGDWKGFKCEGGKYGFVKKVNVRWESDQGSGDDTALNGISFVLDFFPTTSPTNTPTLSPTNAPTHQPTSVPTNAPTHQPTSVPGVKGDPHFMTWSGVSYDFHGICDLVLLKNPFFNDGMGMYIHLRSKKIKSWSYVSVAAIRIGNNILEAMSGNFWFDGVDGNTKGEDEETGLYNLSKYQVYYKKKNEKQSELLIVLDKDEKIKIGMWHSFVSVSFENAKREHFEGSLGLMGTFPEGVKMDRDNKIVLEDLNDFGEEWQVHSNEHKLFRTIEGPQNPQRCEIPSSKEMRRHLAVSAVTLENARKSCANVIPKIVMDLCVFDVMATNNELNAGAY